MSDGVPAAPGDRTRISYVDLWLVWHALQDASAAGKGVVRRAADEAGIDASLLSRAIDRVEAAFGGSAFLVTRDRRTASLTPAGKIFLKSAQPLIDAWALVRESLDDAEAGG